MTQSRPTTRRAGSLLITSNFSNKTGFAWTSFFRLFNHLARAATERGVGVALSFARIEGDVDLLDQDLPHDVFVFNPRDITLRSAWDLCRDVRRYGIRYLYLTDCPTWHWAYALVRFAGVRRIVVHSHISVDDPFPPASEKGVRSLLKALIQRTPGVAADAVFTCSEFVKDRLVRKARVPSARITILNYGLPESRFLALPPDPPDPRRRRRILCTARATRHKGIQYLIEATRLLKGQEDLPDFLVTFAGDGPDLDAFREQAREAGVEDRFEFLGYVADTTELLRDADIVTIPSAWGDAFPYSVLEALAAGRAVVASRAGGIPEEVGEDGSCGILVPPAAPEALAEAIATLLRDDVERRRMARNARQRAEALFREPRYFNAVEDALARAFDWRLDVP